MCRITGARRLPVLKCAKRVTMRRERLMRRVGVIFPDLVVPGRITMKLGRVSVMCRSISMVPSCGLTGGCRSSLTISAMGQGFQWHSP